MEAVPGLPLREAFRGFMSTYFTGVAVITSLDGDGRPHGLTCNSLTSITLSPPTLLVSLGRGSGTLDAVLTRKAFAVNLLHDGGRRAAEIFSSPDPGRFTRVAWHRSPQTGLPLLAEDAYATAECELAMTNTVGDHVVVFGSVTTISTVPADPLLYGMRGFATRPQPATREGREWRVLPGTG